MASSDTSNWLLLVYQFPGGPGSARVKFWRRLQALGAIAVKNSMYVLPATEQTQEDFHWLLAELKATGADAALLMARFVDGMTDEDVRALFNSARDVEYRSAVAEIESALAAAQDSPSDQAASPTPLRRLLARSRRRLAELEAIDFFDAAAKSELGAALKNLSQRLATTRRATNTKKENAVPVPMHSKWQNRVWVTRKGAGVDRIASAWFIRRFLDPDAAFRFVPERIHTAAANEVRFDMFEAEFTHQGDRCTFEVLVETFAPEDAALRGLGEIVHDIDMKDQKFERLEAPGVGGVLAGIMARTDDDQTRLRRGYELFDDLYGAVLSPRA